MIRSVLASAALSALLAGAVSVPAPVASAPQPRAYVLNQWGGVASCALQHNPTATAKMVAYCSGARVPSADPRRFDCRDAEVATEFDFCNLPYPTRSR